MSACANGREGVVRALLGHRVDHLVQNLVRRTVAELELEGVLYCKCPPSDCCTGVEWRDGTAVRAWTAQNDVHKTHGATHVLA